jgi:hypothetical protein
VERRLVGSGCSDLLLNHRRMGRVREAVRASGDGPGFGDPGAA